MVRREQKNISLVTHSTRPYISSDAIDDTSPNFPLEFPGAGYFARVADSPE